MENEIFENSSSPTYVGILLAPLKPNKDLEFPKYDVF